jgi:hypothetical protein
MAFGGSGTGFAFGGAFVFFFFCRSSRHLRPRRSRFFFVNSHTHTTPSQTLIRRRRDAWRQRLW